MIKSAEVAVFRTTLFLFELFLRYHKEMRNIVLTRL